MSGDKGTGLVTGHCEWCERPPTWRFFAGAYERFCCPGHIQWTRRLLVMDLGAVEYGFDHVHDHRGGR